MTVLAHEPAEAFELKGEMSILSVLRIYDPHIERIAQELAIKVEQAPGVFRNMPVIIDLQALTEPNECPSFPELRELLTTHGLVPVGVRNGNTSQNRAASDAGLALLQKNQSQLSPQIQSSEVNLANTAIDIPLPEPAHIQPRTSKLVVRPVRSGQQLLAANGDLVVVAPVGAGSELLADGCIHVYGPLRGRALAGINGDETARIFCQRLEAELISIAGHYQISEDLAPEIKGKPAQVWLENQRLMIAPL
jgi:septum site-determining protein MinC